MLIFCDYALYKISATNKKVIKKFFRGFLKLTKVGI